MKSLAGLILLPITILRIAFWPLAICGIAGVVIHFIVKCW